MDDIRLLRLDEVTDTQYFQLLPGNYRGGRCWADDSVYIEEEVFGYLEKVIARHVPEFDHFAFTDVPREQWVPLLQDLTQLAGRLDAATGMDDVRGDLEFVFLPSEERFAADFAANARALAAMVRDVVAWVGEQLKTHNGVAILGI